MNNQNKQIFIWIIIFILMIMNFNVLKNDGLAGGVKNLAFSDFLNKVEDHQVNSVKIQGRTIEGVLADGSSFNTYTTEYPGLVDKLSTNGVYIEVTPDTKMHSLFSSLLPGAAQRLSLPPTLSPIGVSPPREFSLGCLCRSSSLADSLIKESSFLLVSLPVMSSSPQLLGSEGSVPLGSISECLVAAWVHTLFWQHMPTLRLSVSWASMSVSSVGQAAGSSPSLSLALP